MAGLSVTAHERLMRTTAITLTLLFLPASTQSGVAFAQPAGLDARLTPEQRQELDEIIHVITSERNDRQTRRFGAERLLRSDLPTRIENTAALLSTASSPGSPMAVCEALVAIGTRNADLLDDRLVDPLLNLLGHEDAELSSAAAAAISLFRSGDIARRLGAMAADEKRPPAQRMAAIDALALNADSRDAVRELIALISTEDEQVVARAINALRPASRLDYGDDVAAWQSWWERKSALKPQEWLQDRLDLALSDYRTLRSDYQALQRTVQSRQQVVAQRFHDLLGTIYLLTPQPAQKEARLQQWLADPLVDYRLCALGLVRARIIEGDTPSPAIHEAVRTACADGDADVRIAALEIVGNLKNPEDAPAVLTLLAREKNPQVRETMLRVLGRLENAAALKALTAELNDPSADPGCVREAARALGTLGARGRVDPVLVAPAVEPLARRLEQAPEDNLPLREALLQAMAAIGDPSFKPVFVENLSAQEPELLLAAIRGIKVIGARDHIDRLLAHLTHVDPRVRQVAADAVGTLGGEAHLEVLLSRLSPNVEPNEGVREAAWNAFRAVVARLQPADRLRWANRLNDRPELQIRLLTELIEDGSANGMSSPELIDTREHLVHVLLAQDKHGEAVPHLLQLRSYYLDVDPAQAADLGVQLVAAVLRSGRHDRLDEIIVEVAQTADQDVKTAISEVIEAYLVESAAGGSSTERSQALLEGLRALPPDTLGPGWQERLKGIEASLSVPGAKDDEPRSP